MQISGIILTLASKAASLIDSVISKLKKEQNSGCLRSRFRQHGNIIPGS